VTDELQRWIAGHDRVFVLSGAGCSTASGIPDYRDENGEWKRRPPVMIQAFRDKPDVYRRYWARAYSGWPAFTSAAPGAAHHALATWERTGTLAQLVTQNVDGLHQRAGSRSVIDLHGRLDDVVCLGCGNRTSRGSVQTMMRAMNPDWTAYATTAPDGDADIDGPAIDRFAPPRCDRCGGLLKPDVIFFGENVPSARVDAARQTLACADALLVAGSSLMVYSGFRFARFAADLGLPIAIVNRGRTRADEFADLKVEGDIGTLLSAAIADLTRGG
jgi:NAD-dependent SIR2 family protein deacetylase